MRLSVIATNLTMTWLKMVGHATTATRIERTTMIDEYRRLIDLIVSEGLDTIESLTDEQLREVMANE